MEEKLFLRFLEFLDSNLFSTNGNELEEIFEDSKFGDDYLTIDDYFDYNTGLSYAYETFIAQYSDVEEKYMLDLITAVYNILFYSRRNRYEKMLRKIEGFCSRMGLFFMEESGYNRLTSQNKVGEGHYADVYSINEEWVVKKLKDQFKLDKKIVKRFKYEFEMQEKLSNIDARFLQVHEFDEEKSEYKMRRADYSLYEYLTGNVLTESDRKNIVMQLLEIMDSAHKNGIVHRDLHLGNILVKDDRVYVVDYGLAKDETILRSLVTSSGPKNSHFFVAPENNVNFKLVDTLSDIYSIGKIIQYIMSDALINEEYEYIDIVGMCCRNKKADRLNSVEEILKHVRNKERNFDDALRLVYLHSNIDSGNATGEVLEYLKAMVSTEEICDLMVHNQWAYIYNIVIEMEHEDKIEFSEYVVANYSDSIRYGGWSDYDVFGYFGLGMLSNSADEFGEDLIVDLCFMVKGCADYRYSVENGRKELLLSTANNYVKSNLK